jgi:L-fucose isomerase-like protein
MREMRNVSRPRIGLVAVASIYEAGVDETEGWMDTAASQLKRKGLEVLAIKPVLTDQAGVRPAVERLRKDRIDLLVIINGTWAADSVQVNIIKEVWKPTLLWALPYPKTFSLASVQHLGSVLKELGVGFDYVYGSPDDESVISRISETAKLSQLASLWGTARIGKVGRRYTWRTMGPADITYDELDLELSPGPIAVHIDMDELQSLVARVPDSNARELVDSMRKSNKLGVLEGNEKALIEVSKLYFAVKEMINKYHLDAVTIECYPKHPGIDNVASALLAEEGIICVCEGDLGHTALSLILQILSNKPVGLLEPVQLEADDTLILRHEGSGAPSLSDKISDVTLKPVAEDRGVIIFSAVKPGTVTLATVWGRDRKYKMSILKGEAVKLSKADIERYGGGLVAKIKFGTPAKKIVDRMIRLGVDHHLMLALGDLTEDLTEFCRITNIQPLRPDLAS